PYSVQLMATGGDSASYSWSVQLGTAESWLSADGNLLTGTPPAAPLGTQYQITVTVFDSSCNFSAPTTLTIPLGAPAAAIQITPATLPPAEVNQKFSYQFSATGPTGIGWSMQGAPSWLTISSSGLLSGTPPATGAFGITVIASAGEGSDSVAEELTIYPALAIAAATLPPAVVNVPYSQQIGVSGGPSHTYTLSASGLPPGIGLANNGTLSGTPTSAGAFSISVTAKDAAGYMANGIFPLTVAPALAITPSLPPATLGAPYSQTLSASGGTGGYSWTGSGLPQGLSLASNGQISGTPATAGSFPMSVTVKDSAGDSTTVSITLLVASSLQITSTGLPSGNVGTAYLATLSTSGATGAVTWSRTSGTLPSGLALSSNGTISGTPAAVGDSAFTVQAIDSTGLSASASFTIHIALPPNSTFTVSLPPSLTPGSQPAIAVAISPAYPLPLTATAILAISPDLNGPTDLGFSNGARTIQFTIPANTPQYQLPFSAGTSAGTITVTLNVDTTGQSITIAGSLVLTGQVGAQAPSIGGVTATASTSASTLTVVVTGFSSTRDMKTAAFHFTPAAGATLATSDFSVDVSSIFSTWYANPNSFATGSQFKLNMPFTITGSIGSISSVTVTLTNSNAASTPATATVQ
ncbi:MAG TPA: putative Ig domain-containing protein, partial [Bryobacteraceae bacterium]|nr:putative Ig domain-containing protein [Bryobacteraceae bacterium]